MASIDCIMTAVDSAITSAVYAAKAETIDKMSHFFTARMKMDDEIAKLFVEFKELVLDDKPVQKKQKTEKPKRKLTYFNLFTQEKMKEMRAANIKGNKEKGTLLQQASNIWKNMTEDEKNNWKENNKNKLDCVNNVETEKEELGNEPVKTPDDEEVPVEVPQEVPDALEEKMQKKIKNTTLLNRVPGAKAFFKMIDKHTLEKPKRIKKLVLNICEQLTEELPEGKTPSFSFRDELFDALDAEELIDEACQKLMDEYDEFLKNE